MYTGKQNTVFYRDGGENSIENKPNKKNTTVHVN